MGHHHHDHHQHTNKKVLAVAFILTFLFALLEVVTGFLFHSLTLLSEGIHMLSDGISLFLSLIAATVGMKAANHKFPFGYRRIETIAAFVNGLALLLVPIWVVFQAIDRFLNPKDIESLGMLNVAVIGLVINLIVAFVLSRGEKEHNLNLKSASLHVLADLLSSVATIATALIIYYFDFRLIDPLMSVMVSIVIFSGGIKITRDAFLILMESTPDEDNAQKLQEEFLKFDDVLEVLELKTWAITSMEHQLSAKISVSAYDRELLEQLTQICENHHYHSTIELVAYLSSEG